MVENTAFDADNMMPAFDRATRLAKSLFACHEAMVVLIKDGRIWRSRGDEGLPSHDPVSEYVIANRNAIWIADLRAYEEQAAALGLTPNFALKFYAGAPILSRQGEVLGVICVVDAAPRPRDRRLLARLQDLADGIADDYDRLRLIEEARHSAEAARDASDTLSSLVRHIPMGVVMTDRDRIILKASPLWSGFYGRSETEVVGMGLYDVAPDFRKYEALHGRVLAGKHEIHPRFALPGRNGAPMWLNIELIPWRGHDGEVGGMMITTTNVTDMVLAL
ncbi:MAG: PAS domain S-box protein, partial [Caulobacteraceae bacterium]